jgi:hypothetical protein
VIDPQAHIIEGGSGGPRGGLEGVSGGSRGGLDGAQAGEDGEYIDERGREGHVQMCHRMFPECSLNVP